MEHLYTFASYIKKFYSRKKNILLISLLGVVFIFSFYIAFAQLQRASLPSPTTSSRETHDSFSVNIATFGSTTELTTMKAESSWPGEIVSLANLQIQPGREGTIAQWYVHIGERVKGGQIIGILSRPPQTTEIVSTLAQQSEDLSKMQTSASAERIYTETRIQQLKQLRDDTVRTTGEKEKILTGAQSMNLSASLMETKKIQARALLRTTITRSYALMSGSSILPPTFSSFQLKSGIAAQNSSLRESFVNTFFTILADVNDSKSFPEKSGLMYFDAVTKLANASLSDGSVLSQSDIDSLKEILSTNQVSFATLLGEIKTAELENLNSQKESIDKLAEIDANIAELEKTLTISTAGVVAKKIAYTAIRESFFNGYSIVAPHGGIVSNIMKKPGDFVIPGMPVAIITGDNVSEKLVRFHIPNNVRKPTVGEIFSVTRPGFSSDKKSIRLYGIGSALDETGSFVADALFSEPTEWPIGASVRISQSTSGVPATVLLTSVLWNLKGEPYLWIVSPAGRVYAKNLKLGRTLGGQVEIYDGLTVGDRYIVAPTSGIVEDMLIDDISSGKKNEKNNSTYEDMMRAMGM